MVVYFNNKYAYREYNELGILFAKMNNPDNEFWELNENGKEIMSLIVQNNEITLENLMNYLNKKMGKNYKEEDVSKFIEILLHKGVLYIK